MDIFCLEGKDDGGRIVFRVFTHLSGCYQRLSFNIANKIGGASLLNSCILSIEDVRQITDKGGEYLYQTIGMAESHNHWGLSLFAVVMTGEASDVKLYGPNPNFVRDFESRYKR